MPCAPVIGMKCPLRSDRPWFRLMYRDENKVWLDDRSHRSRGTSGTRGYPEGCGASYGFTLQTRGLIAHARCPCSPSGRPLVAGFPGPHHRDYDWPADRHWARTDRRVCASSTSAGADRTADAHGFFGQHLIRCGRSQASGRHARGSRRPAKRYRRTTPRAEPWDQGNAIGKSHQYADHSDAEHGSL